MGTHGYGPFDCDDGGSVVDVLVAHVNRVADELARGRKRAAQRRYAEARAAIVLLRHGALTPWTTVRTMRDVLNAMLVDDDYTRQYEDQTRIQCAIMLDLKTVEEVLANKPRPPRTDRMHKTRTETP